MQDGARGHRGLPVGAFVSEGFGFEQPSSAPAASPADKPYWTTPLEKVLRARALRRKAALELVSTTRGSPRSDADTTLPCTSDPDAQLTRVFLFCTLNLDWPEARAQAVCAKSIARPIQT